MARLYVFAIGGTGARVMKSLTMLLASGMKTQGAEGRDYEIVPILIDPHKANADLHRCGMMLNLYQKIKKPLSPETGFFHTRLKTLKEITDSADQSDNVFAFDLNDVNSTSFRDYIGYTAMGDTNKQFMDFLFSGKTIDKDKNPISLLDIDMDIGFVGNPNVGSVVLNRIRSSETLKDFASNYTAEDRVFIISSIFGGTGAAGFPIILKNIRDAIEITNLANKGNLENARIGAVTVMPYFNIEPDENSPVNAAQFIAKTKAALNYYSRNVNPAVNVMYYIADKTDKPYKNDAGSGGQKNDAHLVELIAATALFDFLKMPDSELVNAAGKPVSPVCKEFGVKSDVPAIAFQHLGDGMMEQIATPLTRFMLFRKYMREELPKSIGNTVWCNEKPEIGKSFLSTPFMQSHLQDFFNLYDDWLRELGQNLRGFAPFQNDALLDSVVTGIKPRQKSFFNRKTVDYHLFNTYLSTQAIKGGFKNEESKLLSIFYAASHTMLMEHFDYFNKLKT